MILKNKNFISSFLCLFFSHPILQKKWKKYGWAEVATPFSCFRWLKA
jgi:hypothetical protein